MNKKQISIVNPPLVEIGGKLRWGVPRIDDSWYVKRRLNARLNAGEQIKQAFLQVRDSTADLVIVADDTFAYEEKNGGRISSDKEIRKFLQSNFYPSSYGALDEDRVIKGFVFVLPPEHLALNVSCFSEKKLLLAGRKEQYLGTECATKWGAIARYLQDLGYEDIIGYFPEACSGALCSVMQYGRKEAGIHVPVTLKFTNNKNNSMREVYWQ